MLNLTVAQEEYLQIGDDIKVVFVGRNGNYYHIMIDAPKDVNIVRSSVLEKQATSREEREKIPKFYAEPKNYRPRKNRQADESQTETASAKHYGKTATGKRIYISNQNQ